jgi:hypothetical protein
MLYYFPNILAEYNTWINNLHNIRINNIKSPKMLTLRFFSPSVYISCDLCEKNAIYSAKNISGSSWWTMDLLKEVQFIWNFLSQDKKKVTF